MLNENLKGFKTVVKWFSLSFNTGELKWEWKVPESSEKGEKKKSKEFAEVYLNYKATIGYNTE